MCGIAGFHRIGSRGDESGAKMATALLKAIEYRGTHATGAMCVMDDGERWIRKDTVRASKFVKSGRTYARGARTTILHTRWATKGSAKDVRNAHPLEAGPIAVVHNGVLHNDDEIFSTFGLPRAAEVDSEAIPALVQYAGWDQLPAALALIDGTFAVAVVNRERPDEVILARSYSSPLVYAEADGIVGWASTLAALMRGFAAAGIAPPPVVAVKYLRDMHLVRINGSVGAEERFAEDPVISRYYGTSAGRWSESDWSTGAASTYKRSMASAGHKGKGKRRGKNRQAGTRKFAGDQSHQLREWLEERAPFNAARPNRVTTADPGVDQQLVEDIAVDLLVAEGFTLEEAAGIVKAESRIALEWRDGQWEDVVWEDDVPRTRTWRDACPECACLDGHFPDCPIRDLYIVGGDGTVVHGGLVKPADDGAVVHGQRRRGGGRVMSKSEATIADEALS